MQGSVSNTAEALPKHEELFLDYAERVAKHRRGRRAVHLQLSGLQRPNRRETHVRVAVQSFDALVNRYEGQCYLMSNSDIVVIVKDAAISQIDDVVLKLRYLFREDPFVEGDHKEGDGERFCNWFDLEQDYDTFLQFATRMQAAANEEDIEYEIDELDAVEPQFDRSDLAPMDPARLTQLVQALSTADITSWIRRQPVCALLPETAPQPVFNEVYVSMTELQSRMVPGFDILSNRWLFQYLTEAIDKRVLKYAPELESKIKASTSLNLNMSTVMAPEFQQFDRALRSKTDKSMVIEFQAIDVFSNVTGYRFARDIARNLGYKVCLDGLDDITFPLMAQDELEFDLQKIIFAPELMSDSGSRKYKLFRSAVLRADPARVILCRCDNLDAIKFGRRLGISLFQGRYIDNMIKTRQVL